ncbi:MAG: CDP-alcohol phosphatidyltransferase family protein [Deltaproteobacteria bacterium]|nr:CDP-alcohol phosphatidyltransferase family protein [Deltaproteobacteria bacterium]
MIRFKDLITLLNPCAAFISIVLSLRGDIFWAATTIFIAYFFDAIDGSYAKLTKTGNRFGAELDSACDSFSFGVAPAFLVFAVFGKFHPWLGYFLGLWLIVTGQIRSARSNMGKEGLPGYFIGLQRPVSAMMIAALINSSLFTINRFWIVGAFFVFTMGIMNLTFIPYINHRQKFSKAMKIAVYTTLFVTLVPLPLLGYPWEGILALFILYTIHPFVWIHGKEKERLKAYVFDLKKSL